MPKFKAKTGNFKKQGKVYETISIYEMDDEGFQKYPKATICIGVKKAKALLACIEDLKKFVEDNMPPEELNAMVEKMLVGDGK